MTSERRTRSSRSEGGVPIKAWTRGVPFEDEARPAAAQRRAAAVHPQVGRGDARRALGHRRDRRQRDPDRRRDHPGRGRRRHRLRHDGGADDADAPRPARRPARAAHGDRARGAARPHRQRRPQRPRRVGATRRAAQRRGVGARSSRGYDAIVAQAPAARPRQRRQPPRHARHRQPLHRGLPRRGATASGSCCTAARAASATASAATSSSWRKQDMRALASSTCRTRTSPTCRRAREHFDDYVEAVELGAGLRARRTAS